MIEEVFSHVVIVTLFIVLGDGVVLIQVERDHILERNLTSLAHFYELLVHLQGRAPCRQP